MTTQTQEHSPLALPPDDAQMAAVKAAYAHYVRLKVTAPGEDAFALLSKQQQYLLRYGEVHEAPP